MLLPEITLCRFQLEMGQSCRNIKRAWQQIIHHLYTQHHPQYATDTISVYIV